MTVPTVFHSVPHLSFQYDLFPNSICKGVWNRISVGADFGHSKMILPNRMHTGTLSDNTLYFSIRKGAYGSRNKTKDGMSNQIVDLISNFQVHYMSAFSVMVPSSYSCCQKASEEGKQNLFSMA